MVCGGAWPVASLGSWFELWWLPGWQYIRPICVVEGWVVHRLAGWRGARCKWVVYNHPVRTAYGMILKDLV